jgi:lysophospholipase L1-like esterase
MRNTSDPASGRKISSIVNRNVNRSQNKGGPKDSVIQPSAGIQRLKSNKHTVKIIGDSHLRNSVMRINQYLNSKYEATGFIKPGATTKEIVTSGEHELQELGEKDVIVLNCGANDIEKVNSSISAIITPVIVTSDEHELQELGEKHVMVLNCGANDIEKVDSSISAIITPIIDFSQKYSNTNIIVLEIPHRHDLHHKDMTNICIQSVNTKLKSTLSRFKHVTILDMNTTRNHFTKHGLHLNKLGKEWLARKIASQIDKINTTREVLGNSVPLNMTNEVPCTKSTNKEPLQEDKQTDLKTTTTQMQLTQDLSATTHSNNRSSTRVKKTPSLKYSDFLW